jgi:hypothetical protein
VSIGTKHSVQTEQIQTTMEILANSISDGRCGERRSILYRGGSPCAADPDANHAFELSELVLGVALGRWFASKGEIGIILRQ